MSRTLALASALWLGGCALITAPAPGGASREELADHALEASAHADRFGGKLFMVLLDDKTHPSLRDGRSLWATSETIAYTPSNETAPILVPKGFVTDLASIPRVFWDLLPPDGPWVKAAVIHDYLYYTKGTGVWRGRVGVTRRVCFTRAEADWILRDAMQDRNVDGFRRNLIYLGVRTGGQSGWDHSPGATVRRNPVAGEAAIDGPQCRPPPAP